MVAKVEIVKTKTSIVGTRGLTLFSTYSGGNSGSNYHPVGTTKWFAAVGYDLIPFGYDLVPVVYELKPLGNEFKQLRSYTGKNDKLKFD